MSKGHLLGLSLGPGDAGLITRKAWAALQSDGVWCYPVRKRGGASHALNIVARTELAIPDDAIELLFPMTHNSELLTQAWSAAAQRVLPTLQAGRDVLFLVEGDASTYSTFTYLARYIQAMDKDIVVEIVAGVPSFNAAAASTATPLAERDDTIAIVPAGYGIDELESLLPHFDSLVLLKVKPLLNRIVDWLEQRELLEYATFVEQSGTPDERTVHDIRELKGERVNYLSLMLIRNPHRKRASIERGCKQR
ncbi:MAG: precorrin-2 C(20)-methyltransferase [Mariprofundales bacterium]|nr:precorrin-2 C(20)-methyltransferase [Mariprofundales bacterium]